MADNLENFRCVIFVFYLYRHYSISKTLNSWSSLLTRVKWTGNLWHSQELQATTSLFTYTQANHYHQRHRLTLCLPQCTCQLNSSTKVCFGSGLTFSVFCLFVRVFFCLGEAVWLGFFASYWFGVCFFFLKKKCLCSLVSWSIWRTGAGSFKAPEIGEAQSITEFSFCSISITEPLVVSLVTSNTCC